MKLLKNKYKIITFDGGGATGKDTLASNVAKYLGFRYIDSGKMYRLIAYFAKKGEFNHLDEKEIKKFLDNLKIKFTNSPDGHSRISYYFQDAIDQNWKDITDELNDENVIPEISVIAQIKSVRKFINAKWIDEAKKSDMVFSGRAIFSQTFADYYVDRAFFVICDPQEAGKRRWKDLKKTLPEIGLDKVIADIIKRNEKDQNHLEIYPGMIVVDNTGPLEDTLHKIYQEIKDL